MNPSRVRNWRARGFAAGLAAQGSGAARALQVHPIVGTFSGAPMVSNAAMMVIFVPLTLLN